MPPILGGLLAVIVWGVAHVATKAAVREISPVAVVFGRTALGALLLAVVLPLRKEKLLPPRSALLPLAVMAFFGVAFHQILQAQALTLTSAVNTGWLIGLVPVWSALLAAALGKERFGPAKVLGIAVAFAGALLVITRGRIEPGLLRLPSTRGDLLVLVSTVNWAAYTVLGQGTIRRVGPSRATAAILLLGTLMLLPPLAATDGFPGYGRLSPAGAVSLLFLGLACSGVGYLLWSRALEEVEPSRGSARPCGSCPGPGRCRRPSSRCSPGRGGRPGWRAAGRAPARSGPG